MNHRARIAVRAGPDREHAPSSPHQVVLHRFAVATQVNPWPIALPAAAGIAAGAAAWGAVYPSSQLFGPTLCRTRRPTQIALTFDDGPNPAITPQLLALLERRKVRATFFLVGQFARACPALAREIAAGGHTIGNHTETHANLALALAGRVEQELARCQKSVADVLDRGAAGLPRWVRPPFGFRRPLLWRAARRAGLRGVVMWSLTGYDWKPQPPERLIGRLARVVQRRGSSGGGEIVLLHDGDFRQLGADRSHVLAALDHWLPRWQDAGFEFVTMDQVAGAKATAA
jgi:peptidoglycan-N-acetylglucosamine deacetylase